MASIRRLGLLRNRHAPSTPVRTIAAMGFAGGLSCLVAAAFPADPEAPVGLLGVTGIVVLVVSAATWQGGDRAPEWVLQALVAVGTLGISLVAYRSVTGLGMTVTAFAYLWIVVYTAVFFTRRAARAHMALIAAAFAAAMLGSDGQLPLIGWIFITVSLAVAGEALALQTTRLRHEAHTDALTGLLNRKGLATASERVFSLADRTGIPLTISLIDLDRFKQVNDVHGHAAGDRMLVRMAQVWSAVLEPGHIVARLGGDEFLVILVGSENPESARELERLGELSPTSWSAGVISRDEGEDLSACLVRADGALYEAKRTRTAQPGIRIRATAPAAETPLR